MVVLAEAVFPLITVVRRYEGNRVGAFPRVHGHGEEDGGEGAWSQGVLQAVRRDKCPSLGVQVKKYCNRESWDE